MPAHVRKSNLGGMLASFVVLVLCALSAGASPSEGFRATDLRCENLTDPTAIDTEAPRLSWRTETSIPSWRQSGYRVLVATSANKLRMNVGDLWDSGKVNSSESVGIVYRGKSLTSNKACYWKVQIWDAHDKASGWSRPGKWEMGLLDARAWGDSQWIGNGAAGPAPYLRREFSVQKPVRRARIFTAGLGYAEVRVNGNLLPTGKPVEREPGYTNFDKRVLYVASDITLKPGKNGIGVILGTGWYDVHDTATWRFEKAPWRGRPRVRLVLEIEFEDGTSDRIVSDSTWKTATGPLLSDGIYTGETYDARLELGAWDKPGFDDSKWSSVQVMDSPKGRLVARQCPPVVIGETIKPISIQEPTPGVYIVDFGQNFAGHAALDLTAPAGTKIRMRYSERLDSKGMIDRAEIEKFMDKTNPPQPFQTDIYICRGRGRERWEQRFSYSGFRYMEVTGLPSKPSLDSFRGRFAHTDLASAGSFECSNPLLNKIQRATRYAYLSNAQNIFTDCPQREKNGWTGDAHLAAEAGLMNFDSVSLYEKWLDDLGDELAADGKTSVIVPTGGWGRGNSHPAWDSAYPIIVREVYRYTGDRRMIDEHYENLKRYVDGLAAQAKNFLIEFDSLGDWLPWKTETPSQLTSTAFLHLDAEILADFARIRGNSSDAAKYDRLAADVRKAFNAKYFDESKGIYANGSQAALSTALYFGLVPSDRKERVFQALVADVESKGHIDTGIIGAKNVLRVLSEGGRSDLAYKIVARKELPGWGHWIEQGATTLWEDWKGESSLNHIMFGDVSNWFIQWLAGIGLDPKSPGFKHILIRPQPIGDLTWVKATHNSPYGQIASSWKRKGNKVELSITIPPNCTATVLLGEEPAKEVGSGSYSFEYSL